LLRFRAIRINSQIYFPCTALGRRLAPQRKAAQRNNVMSEPYPEHDWTGAGRDEQWDLCVYVAGSSPKGQRAIDNLLSACEEHLPGRYTVEIVDVLKNPTRAAADQILAAPTVIRRFPAPIRVLVGDLSDNDRLLIGLELPPSGSQPR
jgi:circadian clock protein KaiB